MAALRHLTRGLLLINTAKFEHTFQTNTHCSICIRSLNYSAKQYDEKLDPAPVFFNREVQEYLKTLTRIDLAKVYGKRKLGEKLQDPTYKFMTTEELQSAIDEAKQKVDDLLQIPPVVSVRKPVDKVLSRDPALEGLNTSRLVFTDITFGVKDNDRLIVVREPDGILKEAEWDLRDRMNQVYMPREGRQLKVPKMFEGRYLENLLNRQEYEFVLDSACYQFEPDDPKYQQVVSIAYQHLNDKNEFERLRSTRHFGSLVFFLVWNKNIDNLILDLIETSQIEETSILLKLYTKLHNISFNSDGDLLAIEDYIKMCSNKKGALELALQAYRELAKEKEDLERGVKLAHGIS